MNPIRVIFFDFGGVLYKTPNLRWLLRLARLAGRPVDATLFGLYLSPTESPYVKSVMSGEIPESTVWDTLASRHRFSPGLIERMRRSSLSPRRLNHPMIHALRSLRPRYRTAILTNAGSDFRATFCRAYPMESWADRVIISAEEGLVKPDPRIYLHASAQMVAAPEECLFLDDVTENVIAARSAGMQAFRFRNNSQALTQLNVFLAAKNETG